MKKHLDQLFVLAIARDFILSACCSLFLILVAGCAQTPPTPEEAPQIVAPTILRRTTLPLTGPHLVVNLGHTDAVNSVAYSPDGRTVLSGSDDSTLKLWDVASGREIRTFSGNTAAVTAVAFSPDGQTVLSNSRDRTLKLWDVATGQEIRTFPGGTNGVSSVAYSPDGRMALSDSEDSTLKLWDVATGQEIRTFSGNTAAVIAVAFSPDGRTALSGSEDGTLELWDVTSGREIRTFSGQRDQVTSVAFSPDGRTALSGAADGALELWDVTSGQEIRTFAGKTAAVTSVAFSPDGQMVLSSLDDNTLKLWDVASGRGVRIFSGHSNIANSVAFSPDGRTVLSGSRDWTLRLWDVSTGKEIRTFAGYTNSVSSVAFSPDGRTVLSGYWDGKLKLWDMATGEQIRSISLETSTVTSVAFSPDGRMLLSSQRDGTLKLWDVASGREIRTIWKQIDSAATSVAFSPDGRTVLAGLHRFYSSNILALWDVTTGKEIRTFSGLKDRVTSVAFSPDGRTVLSGSLDKTLKLWDAARGREIRTFDGNTAVVTSVAFSPDGRMVLASSLDKTLKLWDAASGRKIRTFTGHTKSVTSVAFSPDGRTIISGSEDSTLELWDVASGQEIRTFDGHTNGVTSVAFSPDGRTVLSGSLDKTLKLWDVASGRLLYTAVSTPAGEWLAWTPEGFFAGTDWATHNLVHIVDRVNVIGIDQVYSVSYRPDLVAAKAAGQDISSYTKGLDLPSLLYGASGGLPPTIEILSPQAGSSTTRDVRVRMRVTDQGGGVGRVTVFNGDAPVVLSEGGTGRGLSVVTASFSGGGQVYQALLSLYSGTNTISVSAYNKSNTIESRRASVELVYESTVVTKPDLYMLAVAVTHYRDGDLQLKYPVEDATALAAALQKQEGGLYQSVHVSSLYDEKVTREGLAAAFDQLALRVKPDDVFVLYFAGHGVTYDKDGEYYFLPVNFRYTDSASIAAQGISKDDITKGVTEISAQKSLLFFDTCDSGSFLNAPASRGIAEKTAVDRLTHAVGRATIVASSKSEVALEGYEHHGVFTYALLQGLSGAADAEKRGYVSVKGLSAYVENEVPEITNKMAGYEQVPQSLLPSEDFPLAKD